MAVRAMLARQPDCLHGEISDWAEIDRHLSDAASAGADLLVINGGDGTIRQVVSDLMHASPFSEMPTLAVVPGGQTNMLAGDLGAKARPLNVLADIIATWRRDDRSKFLSQRKILKVRRTPDEDALYGFFFGTAAIISGIEFCREHIYPLNIPMPAAHAAVMGFLLSSVLSGGTIGPRDLKPSTAAISVDDILISPKDYFGIIATTMDRLLLNLHPFSDKGDGPVKFAALEKGPAAVMKAIPKLLGLGGPSADPENYFFSRMSSRIEVTSDAPYTLDGEFYHPETGVPVTIEAGREIAFLKL